jgi:hypothetical protein
MSNEAQATQAPVPTPSQPVEAAQAPIETSNEGQPEGEKPVETAKPEQDPKFAARFAALTRRERQIQEREAKIKAEESEFRAWKKAKETAKINPVAYLEQSGLSYSEITEYLLNNGPKTMTVEEKLAALEERLESDKKAQEEAKEAEKKAQEEASIQETIAKVKTGISNLVETEADAFELISAHGSDAQDLVFEVLVERWENLGEDKSDFFPIERSVKWGCEQVEKYLENQATEKVLKLKKFSPKQEGESPGNVPSEPKTDTQTRTLTNRMTASPAVSSSDKTEYLSDEESKRRAASLLRWS